MGTTPEERLRENVWIGPFESLNQVETDWDGFLTRLTMLLGAQTGRREFDEAVGLALEPVPQGTTGLSVTKGASRE